MMVSVFSPRPLSGAVRVPGDKSISHRALLLAALAEGRSVIRGLGDGVDVGSTMAAVRRLGATVTVEAAWPRPVVVVDSPGRDGLSEPDDVVDAGNSGTTARLALGLAAGLPFTTVLTGDESLRRRPMGRVSEPLRAMGAVISGRSEGRLLPLAVRGARLRAIDWALTVASAQVKTALILAALGAAGTTRLTEPWPTRDHTERILPVFSGEIERRPASVGTSAEGMSAPAGTTLVVPGGQVLRPAEVDVPADPSSAAFFLTAAAATPGSEVVAEGISLNPGRVAFLQVLSEMGAEVHLWTTGDGYEPYGDVTVRSGRDGLRSVTITGERVPSLIDELPVLAVAAGVARGRTVIMGAGELRHKESDRLEGTAALLRLFGAEVEVKGDDLVIENGGTAKGQGDEGHAVYDCHGDHRLAMAAAIAACVSGRHLSIEGAGCVAISYPGFWRDLASLGAEVTEWSVPEVDE